MTADRSPLPDTRDSITSIIRHTENLDIYVVLGFYPTCPPTLGEVFITIGKEGSTLGGLCDTIAILISIGLQYNVPWEEISTRLKHTKFEPMNEEGHSLGHAIAERVDEVLRTMNKSIT